jgi:hypothetical protein
MQKAKSRVNVTRAFTTVAGKSVAVIFSEGQDYVQLKLRGYKDPIFRWRNITQATLQHLTQDGNIIRETKGTAVLTPGEPNYDVKVARHTALERAMLQYEEHYFLETEVEEILKVAYRWKRKRKPQEESTECAKSSESA